MLSSDHVEVWLSTAANVDMPPIGYGNQFGETDLKSPDDCVPKDDNGKPGDPNTADVADCRRWFANQVEYRKQFVRLFTRQWLAAPSSDPNRTFEQFEDFATSAFYRLSEESYAHELPELLKPKADDGFASSFNAKFDPPVPDAAQSAQTKPVATGYTFDILVPWSAFPPSDQLNMHYLWLMIDVFTHAPDGKKMGALSTTSATRVWGKPASFNHVILNVPRRYSISPCAAAPSLVDLNGNVHAAWYFPAAGADPLILNSVFDVENPIEGYMYTPSGVSPIVRVEEHFWKTLPDGSSVCGPQLSLRNGKLAMSAKFSVEKNYFDVKRLDDGWLLVRSGPDTSTRSPFGSGMCGACTEVDLNLYAISPAGEVTQAFDFDALLSGDEGQPDDADFYVSPDWSRVTTWVDSVHYSDGGNDGQQDAWTSTTWCLSGHTYKQCSEEKNVKPPDPRHYKIEQ
jgi:hypothetical protein